MVGVETEEGAVKVKSLPSPSLPITTHQRAFCTGRSKPLAEEKLKDFAVVILGRGAWI